MRQSPRAVWSWPLGAALGSLAILSLIFVAAPQLDLAVSRLFHDPVQGFGERAALELIREAGNAAEWSFAFLVMLPLVLKVAFPDTRLRLAPRATLFVLATFLLGPILIVNVVLKEHWGRARPRDIVEFGGDGLFSRVWVISDQCARNCSFVSGEAAAAFCLVALAFLVTRRWRPAVALATFAFAAAVSFARLAAGAHFLSDILLAWLLMTCVMLAVWQWISMLPASFDQRVESGAARLGQSLRRPFTRERGEPR